MTTLVDDRDGGGGDGGGDSRALRANRRATARVCERERARARDVLNDRLRVASSSTSRAPRRLRQACAHDEDEYATMLVVAVVAAVARGASTRLFARRRRRVFAPRLACLSDIDAFALVCALALARVCNAFSILTANLHRLQFVRTKSVLRSLVVERRRPMMAMPRDEMPPPPPPSSGGLTSVGTLRRSLRQLNPFKSRLIRLPATPRLTRARKVLSRGEEATAWSFERSIASIGGGISVGRRTGEHLIAATFGGGGDGASESGGAPSDTTSLVYADARPPPLPSQPPPPLTASHDRPPLGGSCRVRTRTTRPALPAAYIVSHQRQRRQQSSKRRHKFSRAFRSRQMLQPQRK